MQENEATGENKARAAAKFALQKIYVKDLSFESPRPLEALGKPLDRSEVNFQLNTENRKIEEGVYEVVLTVTVTLSREKTTLYLAEVKQAGLFILDNLPEQELTLMLTAYCPSILYPYAREVVSSMVERGGFPQLLLKPVNFDRVYQQYLKKDKKAAAAAT